MNFENPGLAVFEYEIAVLNQAAPVNGTYYPLLNESNCRVVMLAVNVEDVNETLELQIIADGYTDTVTVAATHSTTYHLYHILDAINRRIDWALETGSANAIRGQPQIEAQSLEINLRKTTAAGAGNLTAVVEYGVKKNA